MTDPRTTDVLIIGSGAAGLTAALNLADRFRVTVLAKGGFDEGSTAWAQGGIAAVLEPGDTFDSHIEDTMIAGAGLNDRAIVEFVVEERARRDRAVAGAGRAVRAGRGRAAPDARGRAFAPPHRPCRRRDRLGGAGGAAEGGEGAPQHHDGARHGRDRPGHQPPRGTLFGRGQRLGRLRLQQGDRRGSRPTARARRSWRPAARGGPTSSRPRRAARPATASRWRGARARASRTWNSCSSTRPASTIWRSRTS